MEKIKKAYKKGVRQTKIEISKNHPPVISWTDTDGWVKREKATQKNLRKHGFSHCLMISVL